MLWMDGKGADSQGPCVMDTPALCGQSVSFYDFSVTPAFPATTPNPEWASTTPSASREEEGLVLDRGLVYAATWAFLTGVVLVLAIQASLLVGILLFQRLSQPEPVEPTPRETSRSATSSQGLLDAEAGGGGVGAGEAAGAR
mmetsp:Transcript_99992/g.278518  ORF Transcript_99992/g.278518 Transcript_99992/m.278518 type:complete len:142 (-) Transcript_99992:39-464(-)